MYQSGSTTRVQIQVTAEATVALLDAQAQNISACLTDFLSSTPALTDEQSTKLATLDNAIKASGNALEGLSTDTQRMKVFCQQGLVKPVPYSVGLRENTSSIKTKTKVKATAQYIPIIDTLARYENVQQLPTSQDGLLRSFRDGSRFVQDDDEPLRIILYNDDIELANPLGSRAGLHKLTMFYYTVHGTDNTRLTSINLVLVCFAQDLKREGFKVVLAPLIADLKRLYTGFDGFTSHGQPVKLKARLEHLVGDNLAANVLLGLVSGFSQCKFCRFCYMDPDVMKVATRTDTTCLRTAASHHADGLRCKNSATKESLKETQRVTGGWFLSIY